LHKFKNLLRKLLRINKSNVDIIDKVIRFLLSKMSKRQIFDRSIKSATLMSTLSLIK